jgi:predicted DNA-binding transcriptional regulator AlpA
MSEMRRTKESRAIPLSVVCDRLGMSRRTADRRLADGNFPIPALPRRRLRGVRWLFSSVDVDRYLNEASTEDVR